MPSCQNANTSHTSLAVPGEEVPEEKPPPANDNACARAHGPESGCCCQWHGAVDEDEASWRLILQIVPLSTCNTRVQTDAAAIYIYILFMYPNLNVFASLPGCTLTVCFFAEARAGPRAPLAETKGDQASQGLLLEKTDRLTRLRLSSKAVQKPGRKDQQGRSSRALFLKSCKEENGCVKSDGII